MTQLKGEFNYYPTAGTYDGASLLSAWRRKVEYTALHLC